MAPSPESSPASPPPPTETSTTPTEKESPTPPAKSPPPPPVNTSPPPPSKTSPPPPEKTSPPPPAKSPPQPPPPPAEGTPPPPPTRKIPPPLSEETQESPPPPSKKTPSPAKNPPSVKSPPPPDASPPPPPTRDTPSSVSKPPPSTASSTALPESPPSTTNDSPPSSTSTSATPSSTNSLPNLSPISLAANNSSFLDSLATTRSNSTASSAHKEGHGVKYGVLIGVLSAVLVIGLVMAIIFLRCRKKRGRQSSYLAPGLGGNDSGGEYSNLTPDYGIVSPKGCFTYDELSTSTNGFSPQNILGSGGFGSVYKGYLQDGREIAVKKLKVGSGQGDREFKAEVEIISRVHHRHLVTLAGYCISDHERLLVYEFVPNNTLENHLHGTNQPVMKWNLRVKVATGSAKGIAYLHEDCHPRIIHRDIKSANILLENNFEAKVADFGLAKLAEELDVNTHVSTRVMGTFGYMAPEYATSGKLTEKSDVFSFGVVLLELITGRKPVDESQPLGEESLVEWARPLLTKALDNEDFDGLADVRMEGDYVPAEMFRMIEAAAACIRHSAPRRPKMSQVVRALDSLVDSSVDLTNGMRPGQSTVFDSRQQSAQIRMFQRMAYESDNNSAEYNSSKASGSSGTAGGH